MELVDVDGKTVYVNLIGACSGCQLAVSTLGGIQQKLIEALGEFIKVVPNSERQSLVQMGAWVMSDIYWITTLPLRWTRLLLRLCCPFTEQFGNPLPCIILATK